MIETKLKQDIYIIDEDNYKSIIDEKTKINKKIHLLMLNFKEPDKDKLSFVLNNFRTTKRFIIKDNIRFYNYNLRNTSRKYYVMNKENNSLISFFKKNNKVVLNIFNLRNEEREFIQDDIFLKDILENLEIIIVDKKFYLEHKEIFRL